MTENNSTGEGNSSPDLFSSSNGDNRNRNRTSHTVRVVDADGKLIKEYEDEDLKKENRVWSTKLGRFVQADKWGFPINDTDDDDDDSINYRPYKSTKIGYSSNKSWWKRKKKKDKDEDEDESYSDNYWSNYDSYSSSRDKENEIVKSDASSSTIYEANRYIQKKISDWLVKIGAPIDTSFYSKPVINNFIANDTFNLYYSPEYKLETSNPQHEKWLDLLSKLNSYMMKVVTNNNPIYSSIVAYHILKQLIINESTRDQCSGSGMTSALKKWMEENPGLVAKELGGDPNKFTNGKTNGQEDLMQQAMMNASKEIAERSAMDELLGASTDIESEQEREEMIKILSFNNNINVKSLLTFVKGVIKNTKAAAGGAKPMYQEESFLDAEEVEDILDLELVPYSAFLEDIHVHDIKYTQKFDVFVDVSGSMSSNVYVGTGENRTGLSTLALAKLVYYKMYTAGIINNVFTFNTQVRTATHKAFLKCRTSGGTSITNVVRHINTISKKPALIISDLCDYIDETNANTFILGIEGTLQIGTPAFKYFIENNKIKILRNGVIQSYFGAYPEQRKNYDQQRQLA